MLIAGYVGPDVAPQIHHARRSGTAAYRRGVKLSRPAHHNPFNAIPKDVDYAPKLKPR